MIKPVNIIFVCALLFFMTSCTQILQTVDLVISTEDKSAQDDFDVLERTLTLGEARKQNKSPYNRMVSQFGKGENAKTIVENLAIQSLFGNKAAPEYVLGVGDSVTLYI